MKDKLKKVGTAIANFVKAIPSFVKSTPKKLHNLVAPKNVTWPSMHNTLHGAGPLAQECMYNKIMGNYCIDVYERSAAAE